MPYMLGCAEYATSMLQNGLMQWLGTPTAFHAASDTLRSGRACVVHVYDYERLGVRRRSPCAGTLWRELPLVELVVLYEKPLPAPCLLAAAPP